MTDIGDSLFHKGQHVWVIQSDGSQRAAEYVGEGEMSAWFGGSPSVVVVYPDDHSGGMVEGRSGYCPRDLNGRCRQARLADMTILTRALCGPRSSAA